MVRGIVSWCLRHSPAQRRPPPRLLGNLRGNSERQAEGSESVAQLNSEMLRGIISWCVRRHSPAQRRPPPGLLGSLRGNSERQAEGSDSVAQLNSLSQMVRGSIVSWCLRHSPAQPRSPPRLLGNMRGTSESQPEPEGSDSVEQPEGKYLQLLLTAGIGSDHIDLKAATEAGLTVAEVTGSNTVSVAEDELTRILILTRNFLPGHHQVINGEWNVAAIAHRAYDLEGKTLGTVGAGLIGGLLLQRLKPFGCNLLYHDRLKMQAEVGKEIGAKFEEDLDAMLPKCDVIVINTPLTEKTKGMFNKEKIAKLKKGVLIVNNARGATMGTQAVVDACFSGHTVKEELVKVGKLMRGTSQGPLGLGKIGRFFIAPGHRGICIGAGSDDEDDFSHDEFAHILLDDYYHEVGPKRLKLAVRWLIPGTLGEDERANCIVLHGYWAEPSGEQSPQTMDGPYLPSDDTQFDNLIEKYKHHILARWPDLKNPTSIEAAKRFMLKEWKKHGKPAGISRTMYLYHGLALVSAIPQNFDIPIGVPMTLDEVGRRAQAVLRDLRLFGDHIGADVMPEIFAVMDPKNPKGPFLLKEIRVHLERTLKEKIAVYRVVAVDGGKCFTGKANSGNNMVILPLS